MMEFMTSMTMVDRRIGSAPFVWEGDFAQGVARAAELGFDGVELHIADPAGVDLPALEAALTENRLGLTAIGTGRAYVNESLSITDPREDRRLAAIQRLEDFIDLGARLHAVVIIGCMRGNVSAPEELPQAMERLTRSMERLDRRARQAGVTLVLEPINQYENNFLCTMGEIADFIRGNHLTNTGLLADTFHMNIEEPDLLASIEACGPEIRYVHVADSNRRYPGCGHLDFPAILAKLWQVGYRGVLSAECLPLPTGDQAARGWLQAVKAMMQGSAVDQILYYVQKDK
ncbi:MAG: TIM barrel protein [Faecousia sp.]